MMIIDIHTHVWPDKICRKAQGHLEGLFKVKMVGEPSLRTLQDFMRKNAVDISVINSVATKPEQVPIINDWLFSKRSETIKIFCAMHPDYPKWKEELQRIKESGDGIKMQPEFQNFYVDDEAVYPLYEEIDKLGLPLLFHCGKELSQTMLVRSSPQRISKIIKQFPRLKLIAAHFGGFELWDEVKIHLLGKDVYMDTAFFFSFLPKEEIRELILGHRPDRLLFGTDFPLIDQGKDIEFLKSLDIPAELKRCIFSANAKELLGIS